jgi:hypothetical protein
VKYDIFSHWEWDADFRLTHDLSLSGRLSPESGSSVTYEPSEVELRPGLCVAWTAREGHCQEPADGLACIKHAADFAPMEARKTVFTAEEEAAWEHLPPDERRRARNKEYMRRKRLDDPGFCNRDRTREHTVDPRVELANARRERIAAMLQETGRVYTSELAAEFGTNVEAIQRDLRRLEHQGRCVRRYGGAYIPS